MYRKVIDDQMGYVFQLCTKTNSVFYEQYQGSLYLTSDEVSKYCSELFGIDVPFAYPLKLARIRGYLG